MLLEDYPASAPIFEVIDTQASAVFKGFVEKGVNQYASKTVGSCALRNILRWLDRNLEELFNLAGLESKESTPLVVHLDNDTDLKRLSLNFAANEALSSVPALLSSSSSSSSSSASFSDLASSSSSLLPSSGVLLSSAPALLSSATLATPSISSTSSLSLPSIHRSQWSTHPRFKQRLLLVHPHLLVAAEIARVCDAVQSIRKLPDKKMPKVAKDLETVTEYLGYCEDLELQKLGPFFHSRFQDIHISEFSRQEANQRRQALRRVQTATTRALECETRALASIQEDAIDELKDSFDALARETIAHHTSIEDVVVPLLLDLAPSEYIAFADADVASGSFRKLLTTAPSTSTTTPPKGGANRRKKGRK